MLKIARRELENADGRLVRVAQISVDPSIDTQKEFGYPDLDFLYFYVKSYSNLSSSKDESQWDMSLKPINVFLSRLTREEVILIVKFYLKVYDLFNTTLSATTKDRVSGEIGLALRDLDTEISLVNQMMYFVVDQKIPIPNLEAIGTRPHDIQRLTFYHDDYVVLTVISLISKMMCPVWGDMMVRTKEYVANQNKEEMCVCALRYILTHPSLEAVDAKLTRYIANSVSKSIKSNKANRFQTVAGGFSSERLLLTVYSTVLVKKLVKIDLLQPDCNIMTYIDTCVTSDLDNNQSHLSKHSNTLERADPKDTSSASGDDGNTSHLETGSYVSRHSADVPVLIKVSAQQLVDRAFAKFNIPKKTYNAAMKYYVSHHVQRSPWNMCVVSLLFGKDLGGANGLYYLDALMYARLVVISQIYLMMRYPIQLALLMTVNTPADKRTEVFSSTDMRIANGLTTLGIFRECKRLIPYVIGNHSTESQLTAIMNWVVGYQHYHNVAPEIVHLSEIEEELEFGSQFSYNEFVMDELCQFITDCCVKQPDNTEE